MKRTALALTLILALLCSTMGYALIPFAEADWVMFRSDPSHTGAGTSNPVLTPTLIWKYTTGNGGWTAPAVVKGVIYIGSDDHNVYALNASNGAKLWNFTTGSLVRSSPAVVNGVVYVGSMDDNVYALNATTGLEIWKFTTGDMVVSSPAVVNGVIYIGSEDEKIYALSAGNGIQLWNYNSGVYGVSSPAVAGGAVYLCGGFGNGYVYALNASSGAQLWNRIGGASSSSPVVVDGIVYGVYGSAFEQGIVFALNATNGATIWSYSTGDDVENSPAVVNSVVYLGSMNGYVYAFNSSSGAQLWNCTTNANIAASPVVANGVVYVCGENGYFYALDASTGAQLWNRITDGAGWGPAVVDGIIYAGTANDDVYAMGDSASFPTPTPTASSSPISTPPPTPVTAISYNGSKVDLAISGNITISQMSNLTITANQSANTTALSFNVTGESGTTGFGNITVPINTIPYGTTPTIYIDGQPASNQGYTQDSNNYYVWYTTHFSTHQISIVFTKAPNITPSLSQNPSTSLEHTSSQSSLIQIIYGLSSASAIVAIVLVVLNLIIRDKKRKHKTEHDE